MEKCTVYFADLSAAGAGTTITNWYWDFGDGNTSTLQNPTHTYLASGAYTVCLTVVGVNANGEQCKDRYCIDIKVEGCGDPQPCKVGAKFDVKIDQCTVYFTDFSASGAGTTITNWYWDFGDGNTSTLQNPVHTYTAAGAYVVCLTVVGVNANGEQCKDRYCMDVNVNCESVQHPIDTKAGSTLSSLEVYPNPANDVVNMQFKLATAGQVAVTITDIQGRILSVVQDGYLNEGFHKINWNVDVRSGLYFITIRTAEGTQQKQLIIQE
jgi:PKD repeat protein